MTLLMPLRPRPYTIPHDQQDAGLRDYRAAIVTATSPDPSLRWIVLALVSFIVGYLTGALA